jgi:hypothetical protein
MKHQRCRHSQLIYGTDLKGIPTAFPQISAPAVENRLNELMKIQQEALAAHELACQQIIQQKPGYFLPFEKGDLIWLSSKNIKIPIESPKPKPK